MQKIYFTPLTEWCPHCNLGTRAPFIWTLWFSNEGLRVLHGILYTQSNTERVKIFGEIFKGMKMYMSFLFPLVRSSHVISYRSKASRKCSLKGRCRGASTENIHEHFDNLCRNSLKITTSVHPSKCLRLKYWLCSWWHRFCSCNAIFHVDCNLLICTSTSIMGLWVPTVMKLYFIYLFISSNYYHQWYIASV